MKKNFGTVLTRTDMKAVIGGNAPPIYLYVCSNGGSFTCSTTTQCIDGASNACSGSSSCSCNNEGCQNCDPPHP